LSVFKKKIFSTISVAAFDIAVSVIAGTTYYLKQKKRFCIFLFYFYGCEPVRFSRLGATDRTGS